MVMTCDNAYDAQLNYIKNNAVRVDLCFTEPTTYTEAVTTYSCANATITSTDFTVAAGDTSGRKLTFSKSGGSGTASQDGTFLAFTDGVDELIHVTTCTLKAVTSGSTVDFNAYDISEIRDPTVET